MEGAREAIVALMATGAWYSLGDLWADVGGKWLPTTLSARLRELGRDRFRVERRPLPGRRPESRAEQYRLVVRLKGEK